MSGHHLVYRWADLEAASQLSGRDKQRVATIFSEQSWDYVVWIPTWILEDAEKDVVTVEASDHLAVGDIEDYSEMAWRLHQRHRNEGIEEPKAYLPKSSVTVFERGEGVERVKTPQHGLGEFAQ